MAAWQATLARQRGRFGLGTFWKEDATSESREASDQRRDRYVTSDATDSDAAGIDSGERSGRVAQSGRNFGRASERYVSKRPQCGEQDT